MTKKKRIPIPDDVSAEVLFLSDRTCCVCTTRGKPTQIHHVDEDAANNSIDNLAVLCLDCHNETMIKGGFGRQLNASQIIIYRKEWLSRVKQRKEKADEIASIQTVTGMTESVSVSVAQNSEEDYLDYKANDNPELLKSYLQNILIIHKAQLSIAQTKWDSGITMTMNQGNYDMVDFYEEVLIELSTFYPKKHFDNKSPKKYFSELISSKFLWHRFILEPGGAGTGGTIVSTIAGGQVMKDLSQMIVDMVSYLVFDYDFSEKFDIDQWKKEW